jgi:hypothetical protein
VSSGVALKWYVNRKLISTEYVYMDGETAIYRQSLEQTVSLHKDAV